MKNALPCPSMPVESELAGINGNARGSRDQYRTKQTQRRETHRPAPQRPSSCLKPELAVINTNASVDQGSSPKARKENVTVLPLKSPVELVGVRAGSYQRPPMAVTLREQALQPPRTEKSPNTSFYKPVEVSNSLSYEGKNPDHYIVSLPAAQSTLNTPTPAKALQVSIQSCMRPLKKRPQQRLDTSPP